MLSGASSAGASRRPGSRRRCAVLGSPIGHSLSPVLHRAAYRSLGLDWQYDAVEVHGDGLADFVAGLDASWRGLSLTMPLKRVVMPLLDEVSATARLANAANTVVLEDDGRRVGHNTDVPGAARALAEHDVSSVRSATIVGGGATATSVLLALTSIGCREVTLWVREPARVHEVLQAAERLPHPPAIEVLRLDALPDAGDVDVVVSTVPASGQQPLLERLVAHAPVVFDVVYDPWPTPLTAAAGAAGRTVVSGLDLLLHQATLQVELMTGCERAPLEAMRSALLAAVEPGPPVPRMP
jgi:shikimate dehydrogenase